MRKTIWFWLCFALTIVLATYMAVRITMVGMGRGRVGVVRTVSISATSHDTVDLNSVATAVAIAPGSRAWRTDLAEINERVSNAPGVRKSAVRRLPDGNVTVRVQMYTAVAQWFDGQNYFPISADGTIVERADAARNPGAVVFTGPVPDNIADITKAAHTLGNACDHLEWIDGRRWNVITRDGITIMLPEDNPAGAIGTLVGLNQNHQILNRKISLIDMRDNARILVK